MKKVACLAVMVAVLMSVGCTFPDAPVVSGIVIDQKGPIGPCDNFNMTNMKTGRSQAQGVIIVGWGDASISTAAASAGITRIHHVDSNCLNVLGIYAKYETIVYGE